MVIWFSLKQNKEYNYETLKQLLKKLLFFHAEILNHYSINAGNGTIINTDSLNEDFNWKLALLKEQFELARNNLFSRKIDLSHIFTISNCDPKIESSYVYTNDPKGTKKRIARKRFNSLIIYEKNFENFELQSNYEY